MQLIWANWIWSWSTGALNSYTLTFSALGGQDVVAECGLSKIEQSGGDPRHAKSAVWAAEFWLPSHLSASSNWGIDGAPVRFIPKCLDVTLKLEVERCTAAMVGKLYFV